MTLTHRPVSPPRRPLRVACLAALLGGGALLGAPPEARAQITDRVGPGNPGGMDLHLFRPAIDTKGFFAVNGSDVLGHKDFSIGLVLDYGRNLMALNDGHSTDYLVH